MHASVEKRLVALEQKTTPDELVLWRTFVRPSEAGPVDIAPTAICSGSWRLDREPGEGVEAFRERAKAAAPRNASGVTVLLDVIKE